MASDLTGGSSSVTIGGKPLALKDKSSFKKTSGDEAGNAGTKGVVSMANTGAVFFAAWSMDVKVEGENVVRNLDIGTHNHASQVGNSPPWPFISDAAPPRPLDDAKCKLVTYKPDGQCPEGETPHHCVPDHCFRQRNIPRLATDGTAMRNASGTLLSDEGARFPAAKDPWKPMPYRDGLCVCVAGEGKVAEHGRIHKLFDWAETKLGSGTPKNAATIGELENAAAHSVARVTGCDPQKLKDQMRDHHEQKGFPEEQKLRADPWGKQPDAEGLMGTGMSPGEAD